MEYLKVYLLNIFAAHLKKKSVKYLFVLSWFNYGLMEIFKPDKSLFSLSSLNISNTITMFRFTTKSKSGSLVMC